MRKQKQKEQKKERKMNNSKNLTDYLNGKLSESTMTIFGSVIDVKSLKTEKNVPVTAIDRLISDSMTVSGWYSDEELSLKIAKSLENEARRKNLSESVVDGKVEGSTSVFENINHNFLGKSVVDGKVEGSTSVFENIDHDFLGSDDEKSSIFKNIDHDFLGKSVDCDKVSLKEIKSTIKESDKSDKSKVNETSSNGYMSMLTGFYQRYNYFSKK
jgi:hypothetical protein